ncbi:hypothetical protein HJO_02785 [Hyphomonas johnsonii MHS-2]|uniref:Uncharacterized protein n=1 Tax=Hyphomonas johnsonii MHS-2 TaxID=1280950 RepID=A0A059FU80_9PROT|nr:hypothetical protein HJO_02785 [Hyphomonas johnsonii MHS-2]
MRFTRKVAMVTGESRSRGASIGSVDLAADDEQAFLLRTVETALFPASTVTAYISGETVIVSRDAPCRT